MVYEGNEKYIFASYSHDDSEIVLPIIRALQKHGCRIWCDEDLIVGENYNAAIARHLDGCSAVLYFLSKNWMESEYCRNEATVGIETFRKKAALLYLEDCKLHYEVLMLFAGKHAVWKDKPDFMEKLLLSPTLKDCFEGGAPTPEANKKATSASTPRKSTRTADTAASRKTTKPATSSASSQARTKLVEEEEESSVQTVYDENVRALRETLENFNIRLKDEVQCTHGPTFTRYELKPMAGVSVRSILNRIDDISLALGVPVRIEAPIPGKAAIGIEVPNKVRETVQLEKLWEGEQYRTTAEPLAVPLGVDVSGEVHWVSLTKAPHMLIAGSTGSGKSMFVNGVLTCLMRCHTPEELRLLLIDPKQVEYVAFSDAPHLLMPVVKDCRVALAALKCMVDEMERRYALMADVGVRNIEGYNDAVQGDPDRKALPYIVVAIDELADLKLACEGNDIEAFICRIAQKARAAGIHLLVCTQRSSVNVITGALKVNIPTRMAFRVISQVDSRTVLDRAGAECLLGKGDALYAPPGLMAAVRLQCAFISDADIENIVDRMKDTYAIGYDEDFMNKVSAEIEARIQQERTEREQAEAQRKDENSKLIDALRLVAREQKVATSFLQRRLGVGYSRALQLIEIMEQMGCVADDKGGRARKVLITPDEAEDVIAVLKNHT